jgi:ParB/RepB/Spo0J family partition protein
MKAPTEIDVHLCCASPKARQIDTASVHSLASSIADCELLTPITVRKLQVSGNGPTKDRFEVIAGMHRVEAFRRLQRETIPAIVLDDVDDLHAELMLIDENLCRNELSPAERASALARRKAIHKQLRGDPNPIGVPRAKARP